MMIACTMMEKECIDQACVEESNAGEPQNGQRAAYEARIESRSTHVAGSV